MGALGEMVYAQLLDEGGVEVALKGVRPTRATMDESDLLDWAVGIGLAWAIARMENPFARASELQEMAVAASNEAWLAMRTVGGIEAKRLGRPPGDSELALSEETA